MGSNLKIELLENSPFIVDALHNAGDDQQLPEGIKSPQRTQTQYFLYRNPHSIQTIDSSKTIISWELDSLCRHLHAEFQNNLSEFARNL